jgi:hypothetical protein
VTGEPLREIEDGVVWYFEGENTDLKGKFEGSIEIYRNWVRTGGLAVPTWIPRERVEQVHER